jgi:hypothetical protein
MCVVCLCLHLHSNQGKSLQLAVQVVLITSCEQLGTGKTVDPLLQCLLWPGEEGLLSQRAQVAAWLPPAHLPI